MKLRINVHGRHSSEGIDNTDHNNIVIKFDSVSVKRMHDLTLDEARDRYLELLKNLSSVCTRTK